MRTRGFKLGKYTCKSYFKAVGKGYEVGFQFGGTPVFTGNFIHSKEANAWWTIMNTEFAKFTKKYWVGKTAPISWYSKFVSNHLYKTYYSWLAKEFNRHQRSSTVALKKNERRYHQLKKNWSRTESLPLKKAA